MSANLTTAIKALEATITADNKIIIDGMIEQLKQMRTLAIAKETEVYQANMREFLQDFCIKSQLHLIAATVDQADVSLLKKVMEAAACVETQKLVRELVINQVAKYVMSGRRPFVHDFCDHADVYMLVTFGIVVNRENIRLKSNMEEGRRVIAEKIEMFVAASAH